MKTFLSAETRLRGMWPALLLTLSLPWWAGCSGFPQVGTGAHHPTSAQVQTAMQWEDHYLYFPGYEIYYNRTQGTYIYLTADGWTERFAPPPGVDLSSLLDSPFVAAPFHDPPARHHARMIRDYPRTWGLPGTTSRDDRLARLPGAR